MIKYFPVVIVIVVGFISIIGMGVMHEKVHVEIYRSYDIDSKIDYFDWEVYGMSVTPEVNCPDNICELAHNINEAFSYPLMFIFAFIVSVAIVVVAQLSMIDIRLGRMEEDGDY